MMKISRFGIFTIILLTVLVGTNCSLYKRVMARKNLVDGAQAYKERNFKEAEERFRASVEADPELSSIESKTAQLFLARTIHSEFAGNRGETDKAENAISEYKKAMAGFLADLDPNRKAVEANPDDEKAQKALKETEDSVGSIVRAVASLFENLKQDEKWQEWQTTQAQNEQLPNEVRAGSYVSLAAKQYNCANDITDTEEIKKTVKEDGKDVFKFSKPSSEEDYDKLKKCVEQGTEYIGKGVELNPESDSAWSYKASLIEQKRRIADMNGESEERDSLKKEFTEAKEKFEELAEKRRLAEEAEEKRKAEEKAKKEGRELPKEGEEGKPDEEAPSEDSPAKEEAPAEKEGGDDSE